MYNQREYSFYAGLKLLWGGFSLNTKMTKSEPLIYLTKANKAIRDKAEYFYDVISMPITFAAGQVSNNHMLAEYIFFLYIRKIHSKL